MDAADRLDLVTRHTEEVVTTEEYGGDLVYDETPAIVSWRVTESRRSGYTALETDFVSGKLHPADLKPAVSNSLSTVIDPVRERLTGQLELLAEAYPETYGDE